MIDEIWDWLIMTFTPIFLIGNCIKIIFEDEYKSHLTRKQRHDKL